MKITDRFTRPLEIAYLPGLIVLCLVLASCSGSEVARDSQVRTSPATPPYKPIMPQPNAPIAVGDSIALSVWGYPEFTTRTVVKAPGYITVPIIGELTLAGYTKEECIRVLRQKLKEYLQGDIKLTVEISSPLPVITVLGAVTRQGSFPTSVETTLLDVLSTAGGWTELADLRYVIISRQSTALTDRPVTEVDLTHYLDTGNIRDIPTVRPGDVVYVPKKENFVRDLSAVFVDAFLLFGLFGLLK